MDDLARFYRALMGGRLLRSAQLAEMKTTVEVAPGYRWGLGLEVVDFACGPMWGHSGDVPGSPTSSSAARTARTSSA